MGIAPVNGSRCFDLIGVMGGDIGLEAASMSFYALDMPGMDDPMPLYDNPDVTRIEADIVTFDKAATPIAASHWDASKVVLYQLSHVRVAKKYTTVSPPSLQMLF